MPHKKAPIPTFVTASLAETAEEAEQLIRESVTLHLEALRNDGDPIPAPTTIVRDSTWPKHYDVMHGESPSQARGSVSRAGTLALA